MEAEEKPPGLEARGSFPEEPPGLHAAPDRDAMRGRRSSQGSGGRQRRAQAG